MVEFPEPVVEKIRVNSEKEKKKTHPSLLICFCSDKYTHTQMEKPIYREHITNKHKSDISLTFDSCLSDVNEPVFYLYFTFIRINLSTRD